MSDYLEEIKRRLPASKVISRNVVLKQKSSFQFLGLCPFHNEKSPSFTVSDDKRFYHCFGCGEHGDIISFVSKIEGINFKDAVEKLAAEAGVRIPRATLQQKQDNDLRKTYLRIYDFACNYYQKKLLSPEGAKARNYLTERGVSADAIKKFRLGFAPLNSNELVEQMIAQFGKSAVINSKIVSKSDSGALYILFRERVMFPILDVKKQVIAFGGRAFGDIKPKYINSNENPLFKKGNELYGLCFVLENRKLQNPIVVVEGYMDVIAMHEAGFKTAVAPLGTAFKLSQLELAWNYCSDPVLMFDGDNAGEMATKKIAYEAVSVIQPDKSIKICSLENFKDPDEVLKKSGVNTLSMFLQKAKPLSEYLFDAEYSLKPLKTPEQKSNLRKRLDNIVLKINDLSLRSQYKNFFRESFSELFARGFKKKLDNGVLDSAAVLQVMESADSVEEELISLLMAYPQVLKNHEIWEGFVEIDIHNKEIADARIELLRGFDEIASMNNKVEKEGELFKSFAEALSGVYHNMKNKAFLIKNLEEAGSYAIRLLKLIYVKKLEAEIHTLSAQIISAPDEADFARLSNLKCTHENLKLELGII
ncbi:MAG: primase [Candidatus Midichloriaceae bacterium]|nr:primase [Candidatus Midichloriaceae bacterium]